MSCRALSVFVVCFCVCNFFLSCCLYCEPYNNKKSCNETQYGGMGMPLYDLSSIVRKLAKCLAESKIIEGNEINQMNCKSNIDCIFEDVDLLLTLVKKYKEEQKKIEKASGIKRLLSDMVNFSKELRWFVDGAVSLFKSIVDVLESVGNVITTVLKTFVLFISIRYFAKVLSGGDGDNFDASKTVAESIVAVFRGIFNDRS